MSTPTETAQNLFEHARQTARRGQQWAQGKEDALLAAVELNCLGLWHLAVGLRATYQAVEELKQELKRQRR